MVLNKQRRYGTRQFAVFPSMGFKQCVADPCLFVLRGRRAPTFVVLYVYDLLIGWVGLKEADEIEQTLGESFKLKSLGDARFILGIEVDYTVR